MTKAVIDADFYIKLTTNEASAKLFIRIMNEMQMTPVMHKYVYKQELKYARFIKDLVEKNQVAIYDYQDYLITEQDKQEYNKYFLDSYEKLTGSDFPAGEDIYTYHMPDENLGEIRSVYLALKMGFPYFATDDGGASSFVKNYVSTSYHRVETISVIEAIRKCKENGSALRWMDLKSCISAVYKKAPSKINEIRGIIDEQS